MIWEAAPIIPLNLDYNIHFFNKDLILIDSTKKKFVTAPKEQMIGMPLKWFSTPSEFVSAKAAILKAFDTGIPVFHPYNINGYSFLYLFCRVDDDTLAAHEVIDDPEDRPRLKRFLCAASANFNNLFKKEVV